MSWNDQYSMFSLVFLYKHRKPVFIFHLHNQSYPMFWLKSFTFLWLKSSIWYPIDSPKIFERNWAHKIVILQVSSTRIIWVLNVYNLQMLCTDSNKKLILITQTILRFEVHVYFGYLKKITSFLKRAMRGKPINSYIKNAKA